MPTEVLITAIIAPTLAAIFAGIAWVGQHIFGLFQKVVDNGQASQLEFLQLFKEERAGAKAERDEWRSDIAEHTKVSKEMYHNL